MLPGNQSNGHHEEASDSPLPAGAMRRISRDVARMRERIATANARADNAVADCMNIALSPDIDTYAGGAAKQALMPAFASLRRSLGRMLAARG